MGVLRGYEKEKRLHGLGDLAGKRKSMTIKPRTNSSGGEFDGWSIVEEKGHEGSDCSRTGAKKRE